MIEQKNKICINVFCNENDDNNDNENYHDKDTYAVHVSDKQSQRF